MRRFFFLTGFFLICVLSIRLNCVAALHPTAPGQAVVAGKVIETMDSGGYTYVRVAQGKDSAWVAVAQQKVKVGDDVSFAGGVVMNDFYSKSLKRTFKKIVFSDGPAKGGSAGPAMKNAPAHGTAAGQLSVRLARAEGPDAYTVSEIFSRRKELAGKTVLVRGKVVKVSLEIMDRNWVHLQDGSGEAKAATHDLVVTTSEEARVGETVTARGTVAKDKDFGSGYKYVVLLEKAAFKR
ncbi:MAG: DNA-binding protein [Elusimicrobiota bacterium]